MTGPMDWTRANGGAFGSLLIVLAIIAIAVSLALTIHRFAMAALTRTTRRTATQVDDIILSHVARPLKWSMVVISIGVAQRIVPPNQWLAGLWSQVVGFAFPGLIGWLAITLVFAGQQIIESRADISARDNLDARRRRTRVGILARIAVVLILFLTVCMMLVSIPGVRSVGVTLMASAGLAALAIGAAAQPALKNLIAGVQMAFTEPIRIDDVVIVAGEWGRIEEIRLTYVVVRVWDDRRLVVPISKFLEEPFQNWTRASSQLLGSAFIYVDPTADVDRLRVRLKQVVEKNPLWDGRFFNLQVTDIKPDVMELRALVTAPDAGSAFDLRCEVREDMMAYLARSMPEALPRRRLEVPNEPNAGPGRSTRPARERRPATQPS
jgi:small-conductance mechanosensitive channel